jgi:ribosomal protein S18 acetylase RimI-like enzyme
VPPEIDVTDRMYRPRMKYAEMDQLTAGEVVALYDSVGWTAYTSDPRQLLDAIERSTYWVTARDDGELVGIARGLSDDFSIFYLQDIIVHPDVQQRGIGRNLIERCLTRFEHVRQRVLLTDDEERQHRLYRAAGYRDVATLDDYRLHAFVNIRGVDLS